MSLEGLKLAALYSYDCQKAKRLKINYLLADFIKAEINQDQVEKGLKELLSYAWYQIIASRSGIKDPFNEKVVRTYWTGSNLLKKIKGNRGEILLPFHNFTVLETAHNQEQDLKDLDNCKISIGRVDKIEGDNFDVSYYPLIKRNERIVLADFHKPILINNKGFVWNVAVGEWITFHYRIVREVLEFEKAKEFYLRSREAVELFNEAKQKDPHR